MVQVMKSRIKHDEVGLIKTMNDRVVEDANSSKRLVRSIHPSSLGECLRKLYYITANEPKSPMAKTKSNANFLEKAKAGNDIHERMYEQWSDLGILVAHEKRLDKIGNINGYVDAIIDYGRHYVVDVKSKESQYYYKALAEGGKRKEKVQLGYYMHRLQLPGMLFYYNTDTRDKAYLIFELDSDWVMLAKERAATISKCWEAKELPAQERSGGCGYCNYSTVCLSTDS